MAYSFATGDGLQPAPGVLAGSIKFSRRRDERLSSATVPSRITFTDAGDARDARVSVIDVQAGFVGAVGC